MASRYDLEGELLPPERSRAYVGRPSGEDYEPIVRISLPARTPLADPVTEREVRRPHRQPSLESDVAVPALQAGLTAISMAIGAGMLCIAMRWPARYVAIAFGVTLACAWLWRMRIVDALLWEVERIVGRDHAAPARSPAEHEPIVVNSWQARQEVRELQAADAGQRDRQALVAYLHRCYVAGTSEKAHGISRGSGAERDNYIRQRDVLLELGIAQWRNPARPSAGWKIVVSHQKALALLAKHTL